MRPPSDINLAGFNLARMPDDSLAMVEQRIILPERGLTLLPPWPQTIVFADKRLENRGASVAGHIRTWRGLIALSQSKMWKWDEVNETLAALSVTGLIDDDAGLDWLVPPKSGESLIQRWSGKLVAVAELLDVLPPDRCEGDSWHVPGQHGLILGQVWEVEPAPIIGGRGCWFAGQCPQCDTLQARDRVDGYCRRCGVTPDRDGTETGFTWKRPMLKIVRECTL